LHASFGQFIDQKTIHKTMACRRVLEGFSMRLCGVKIADLDYGRILAVLRRQQVWRGRKRG